MSAHSLPLAAFMAGSLAGLPPSLGSRRTRAPAILKVHRVGDVDRTRVESYIQKRYAQRYGALIQEWLPQLVSLEVDGEIVSAAGYRSATAPLFLERYLPAPVEQCLAAHSIERPTRARIAEAGQFAAMRPGAGRLLVPLLANHLRSEGFDWTVSTVTQELHHLFQRMGIPSFPLAAADPVHLTDAQRHAWGTYYEHQPVVVAERLSKVISALEAP